MRVIVIGAGVAGLVCARTLHDAGIDVTILESSDGVGGRVRSDRVDGFTLDRGFQVLFTAYPAAARQLAYDRLDLCRFDPGAVICQATRRQTLSDPLRDPQSLPASLLSGAVTLDDKLRTALLTAELKAQPISQMLVGPDETTEAYLRGRGFSEAFIDNFARPFFGSIFQTDSLETSARAFRFDWKMLSDGDTVIPASGMGAIPTQLAERLVAADRIRTGTRAGELLHSADGARCVGVRTSTGDTLAADTVVVATSAPEAARLTGRSMPSGSVGTTQVYFVGPMPVHSGRKIHLHANRDCFVRSAIQVSNVSHEYAPTGSFLLSASILGVPYADDEAIGARAMADLRRMFAGDVAALRALTTYRRLRVYRIPYGQFAQPPGIYETLPENDSGMPGLVFAGEFTAASSINAAMRSGEKAAALLLG